MAETSITQSELPTNDPSRLERIEQQQAILDELENEFANSPSSRLELRIKRETDIFLYMQNLLLDSPKERSKRAAEVARRCVLRRAFA